jgi:hypothetical protein
MMSALKINSRCLFTVAFLAVGLGPFACSSGSGTTSHTGSGGSTSGPSITGGAGGESTVAPGQGGTSAASGGAVAPVTGGQIATSGAGGKASTGGAPAAGGASAVGGALPTGGGVPASGGAAPAGGALATGGVSAAGGGTAGGGTAAKGGATVTGGAAVTGGVVAATGGVVIAGGTTGSGSGGSKATGGATATGGSTPASGVPVLVSTIDLKGASGNPGLRLGDINGDGKMEIVMAQPTDQTALGAFGPQFAVAVTAFDLKGNQLWQYGKPGNFHVASSDIPIQVYDMDGDGKSEVFVNMSTTEMTVLDGPTGKLLRKIPLPATGSNDSIIIANLRGKPWPQDIIVKTRYSQAWAITGIDDATTKAGTLLWNYKMLPSDSAGSDFGTGHYPLVYDWNGDGKDEVMCGYDFLGSDGKKIWSTTVLKMHADSIGTADLDANPASGLEIVINGDVAAAFDCKTGKQLWKDNHTIEAQQIGIGDYRPDLPGLEVVLLDRLRTAAEGFKSNNVLVDQLDNLLWKENRATNSGWLTVTENINNWDGKGSDQIFSYRRDGKADGSGGTGTYIYDGYGKIVASFPYTGTAVQTFAQHADVCGDGKEEVIAYDDQKLWIYANGGCNLDDPPTKPSLPQQFHLYNWSIYTGWINPDLKFYTPGSKQ